MIHLGNDLLLNFEDYENLLSYRYDDHDYEMSIMQVYLMYYWLVHLIDHIRHRFN